MDSRRLPTGCANQPVLWLVNTPGSGILYKKPVEQRLRQMPGWSTWFKSDRPHAMTRLLHRRHRLVIRLGDAEVFQLGLQLRHVGVDDRGQIQRDELGEEQAADDDEAEGL